MAVWPSTKYPFFLPAAPGFTYAFARREATNSFEIQQAGITLGKAMPVDLSTGMDTAGHLFRYHRRSGEDDFSYAGRLQRSIISATLSPLSSTKQDTQRTLSSMFGRVTISNPWDGATSSTLPAATTFLDIIGDVRIWEPAQLFSLAAREIAPLSVTLPGTAAPSASLSAISTTGNFVTSNSSAMINYPASLGLALNQYVSAFRCPVDLMSYTFCKVYVNDQVMSPGRDYLISAEDPTVLFLRRPIPCAAAGYIPVMSGDRRIDASLKVHVNNYSPLRIQYAEDKLSTLSAWGIGRSNETLQDNCLPSVYKTLCASGLNALPGGLTTHALGASGNAFTVQSLVPLPARVIGNQLVTPTKPLLFGQGLFALGLPTIEKRLVRRPGGALPTLLGITALRYVKQVTTWRDKPSTTETGYGPPMDLDSSQIPF